MLVPLWKRKGPWADPTSYRSILVAGVIPKLIHHVARQRLVMSVGPNLGSFQIGGLKRMSVQFAAHYLQARREIAKHSKQSHAIIYLDVCNAFYTAQRACMFPNRLGTPAALIDERQTLHLLSQPTALEELGASESLQRWIQCIMTGSWSQVKTAVYAEHADEALLSMRGSRPGDPVADLAFSTLMYQILQRTIQDLPGILQADGQEFSLQDAPPVAWVDDVALFLTDPSPQRLVEKVQATVQAFTGRCQERGLKVNFQQGKSEVLFRLEGRGSQGVARDLKQHPNGFLPLPQIEDAIAMTASYVHLGIKQCAAMDHDVAALDRLAHATTALRDARPLLLHRYLDVKSRCMLASSLIFSKLLYGSELWTRLSEPVEIRLQAFIMKVYRIVFQCRNFRNQTHFTDLQVRAKHPLDTLDTFIQVGRLRHFARLLLHAPTSLLACLRYQHRHAVPGWLPDLYDALRWARERCSKLQPMPDPAKDFEAWITLVSEDPTRWHRMCRSLRHRTNLWSHIMAQKELWEQEFQNILHPQALSSQPPPADGPLLAFPCDQCSQRFATAKGLSVHRMKQHNEPAHARRYMPDPQTCGACLQRFQNSQKLRQHLQWRSNGCLQRLETLWTPMTDDEVNSVETVYGKQTSYREPALQCHGPALPSIDQWQQCVPEKTFPQNTPFAVLDAYQQSIAAWLHGAAGSDGHVPPLPHSPHVAARDRHRILEDALNQLAFVPPGAATSAVKQALQQALGRQHAAHPPLAAELPAEPVPYQPPILPTVEGQLYILYFYAGHRREGDFHQCLSELRQAYQLPIQVLPIDIVYHQRLCDMTSEEAQSFWLSVVSDKACVGLLGAPPCETWSIARWRAILLGDNGPKPVRSATHPWALQTASMRELRQLAVANVLLQVWLKMAALATIHGISWAMEHPAEAVQVPQAASIWKLPQVQALFAAGARRHTLLQGYYGAVSAKPTTFAVYRLLAFEECAQRWRLRGVRAEDWIQLCGKDSAGNYHTMAAKAYPRNLSFLLAEAYVQRVISLQASAQACSLDHLTSFSQAAAEILAARASSGSEMGRDFAGHAAASST
eukprot:Skav222156  [mRNA]  locus=scaffold294:18701:21919:- [translate_table: standard]